MKDLGILGGTDSRAYGINDSGQVVGYSTVAGNQNYHAFLYNSTNGMKDLGILGGTNNSSSNSYAYGINASGQVVGGSAYDDIGHHHAFLYDSANGMKDLGALGSTNSWATGINNSGEVVGTSPTSYTTGDQDYHAFLYKDGKMRDLGTLGGTNSYAYGINDFEQVVGYSDNDQSIAPYNHAFLYQNGEMIDLGTRTHPDNNGNFWTLGAARGINNKGQIVIDGSRIDQNGTNVYSALLLTPTSDPPPADTQAPSAPAISSSQNNTYDTDGSFSVSGSAEAGSTVELFEGTTSTGKTTKADSSTGAWSIDLSGVSEGSHTYSAKATDAAGNTSSASNTVTVTVDTKAPSAPTITSPADNSNDTDGNITFSGTTAEKGSTVKVYQDGATTTATGQATASTTDGSWTINLTGVSEQSTAHTFDVTATDAAGNESTATTRHVTVGPYAPSSLTASQNGITNSQYIKLAWKDNSNSEKNFVLERSTDQKNWTVLSSTLAPNTTSYTDTKNLSKRTKYYYRVKATNDAGSSDYSNTASATTK